MKERKQWIRMIVSAVVVLAICWFLLYRSDFSMAQVSKAIARFGIQCLAIVLGVCLLQTLLMILRVLVLFPRAISPGFVQVGYAIAVGQAINMFFPARAGDVLKVVLLGKDKNETISHTGSLTMMGSAGVLLADRIIDICSLVGVVLTTGAYRMPGISLPQASLPGGLSITLLAALVLSLAAVLWVFRARLSRLARWARDLKTGFLGALGPRQIGLALIFSVGSWSCEAIAVQTLTLYQGIPITFTQAVFVLCVLNLAIAIPVSIANVGPFEASLIFALGTLGASTSQALAVAAVHHGLQLVGIVGAAVLMTAWRKARTRSGG